MEENNIKIISETFETLPQRAKTVIMSDNFENTLAEIGKKYGLNLGQLGALEKDATMVMMGLTKQTSFESELREELEVDANKVQAIAQEVKEKIFSREKDLLDMLGEQIPSDNSFIPKPANDTQPLDSRFDKLPENIQGVVEKSNYQSELYNIAQAHKLSITQMGSLDTITTDLMVGSIHADQFKGRVLKGLGLSEEEATSLVNEINEKVFKKIRGQMMNISKAPAKAPEMQMPKQDLDTLKSHGIEILSDKLEIEAPHPLIAQKMTSTVQTSTVKNNYELKSTPAKAPEAKKPAVEAPKAKAYAPGNDPYRVKPE